MIAVNLLQSKYGIMLICIHQQAMTANRLLAVRCRLLNQGAVADVMALMIFALLICFVKRMANKAVKIVLVSGNDR